MKLGSWIIVLIGMGVQVVVGKLILSGASATSGWGGLAIAVIGVAILFSALMGVIPMILLAFERTRKIGGVLSIILGLIGLASQAAGIVGIALLIAGIIALWKKA